ncbi:CYTH domain-containing protein [Streptococcus minor]|uniref:CYTH domain-containing protein n=1 Tax=Streptococcus minor TaxID=229549 RepID=A0A3P1VFA6_9STRE|nr:CYTH domain-containing protein [Streptococcus minor]MDO5079359.1 CYTH domain-containing protein [Streptococcus minor]RRD32428.1 CYTH domain-containing protein [Streptococcus minor]
MNQLEIEYKTLLNKAEYIRLLEIFSDTEPVIQTNYYIDTPHLDMKKHRFSLRIRLLPDAGELTLKCPQDVGNMEYNQFLSLEETKDLLETFQLPKGHIHDLVTATQIPISQLQIWGQLTTKRYEKEVSFGLMALDENSYNGKRDYELEVEVKDAEEGKISFDFFLKKHSVKFKYASSKVARAAASLKSAK